MSLRRNATSIIRLRIGHMPNSHKSKKGPRTPRNEDDRMFRKGGNQFMLTFVETYPGYAAVRVGLETV